LAERVNNNVRTALDDKSMSHIRGVVAEWLAEHPYLAAANSISPVGNRLLDALRLLNKLPCGASRERAVNTSIIDELDVLRQLCITTKTWRRLGVSERCAQNTQDIVCAAADISDSLLFGRNNTHNWLLESACAHTHTAPTMTQCSTRSARCLRVFWKRTFNGSAPMINV
jgi:hypothetical protein